MIKKELIDFTIGLYQLTLLFPKKEPLRYKIREIADDILANFLRIANFYENNQNLRIGRLKKSPEVRPQEVLADIEVLNSFLEIAKNQNWVASGEILKFQEKIPKIKEAFIPKEGIFLGLSLHEKESLKFRQQKILEFLREKGKAQVGQLKKIFPEVSKRTLRRDFKELVRQGLIERKGERNTTFYQIKEYGQFAEKI